MEITALHYKLIIFALLFSFAFYNQTSGDDYLIDYMLVILVALIVFLMEIVFLTFLGFPT